MKHKKLTFGVQYAFHPGFLWTRDTSKTPAAADTRLARTRKIPRLRRGFKLERVPRGLPVQSWSEDEPGQQMFGLVICCETRHQVNLDFNISCYTCNNF